jgi:hypothetical protein
MKVQFKFRDGIGAAERKRVLAAVSGRGTGGARRLFPAERDGDLASIYVLEVASEAAGRRALTILQRAKEVEFAEWEVRRKLIRQGRPA